MIIDAHTHLSGSESGESAEDILACLETCGVDKVFIFAPLLDVRSWKLVDSDLDDIRAHNDYCADICSVDPDRLLGFCVLNPAPALARGSLKKAVNLMIEEAKRCYHDLGLRGVKMVPAGWYPNAPEVVRLYQALGELGMFGTFHAGVFLDAHEAAYCRPAYFEAVHQAPDFKAQLAHLAWPWVDECIAVLLMESFIYEEDPKQRQLSADLSFGSPDDWQLETWQRALNALPHELLSYGSDGFWPCTPERYREQYLDPQLGLFEVAATNGHRAPEGSEERKRLREQIFARNAMDHWEAAVGERQQPRAARRAVKTPRAHSHRTRRASARAA